MKIKTKTLKKLLLGVVVFIMMAPLLLVGVYRWMNSEKFQVAGEIIRRVETTEKVVALTFDDGPTEYTDEILQLLREKEVTATFYVMGQEIEKDPSRVKQIFDDGHELGNHSYSHQRMVFKSAEFVAEEIEKTNTLIRNTGYQGEITFRPPFGKKLIALPWYLYQHNIKTITWDVEPTKALGNTATIDQIVEYIKLKTQPGSIILIHPWYGESNTSRAAIGPVIDELKNQGYEFVTVNELLSK